MEVELGKVDNLSEQLSPELREFLAKIIIPLQGFILDDLGELDLVIDTNRRQEAKRVLPGRDDTEHQRFGDDNALQLPAAAIQVLSGDVVVDALGFILLGGNVHCQDEGDDIIGGVPDMS